MTTSALAPVAHRTIDVGGVEIFYREAGPPDAPVVLLPHGYPSSSFQFRHFMPALGDRWRLIAPDFPGFGYSAFPERFDYSFAGYTELLGSFAATLGLDRFALYLHDYGSQVGLRLALEAPERVSALIIQNGDVYAEAFGPKYAPLQAYWANPTPEGRAGLEAAVSADGLREEFIGEIPDALVERMSPDLWQLAWPLMQRPRNRELMADLMADIRSNVELYPAIHAYFREHRPPALIVWGPHDGYMPEASAQAYLTDLPDAELHLLDAGHWALETHLSEIVALVREFLARVL